MIRWKAGTSTVAAGVAGQIFLVVTGPLIARLLGVEDRGHFALLSLVPPALAYLVGLGLPLAVTYEISRQPDRARAIVDTVRGPFAAQAVAMLVIHVGLLALLVGGADHRVQTAGALTLASSQALLLQQYGLAVLQGQQRFGAFNLFRFAPIGLYTIGVVILFAAGERDLVIVSGVWAVSTGLGGLSTAAIAFHGVGLRPGKPLHDGRKAMLKFGASGMMGSSSPVEVLRIDQTFVGLFLSPAALGIYVVAVGVANLPRFIAQSAGIVAYPAVARIEEWAQAKRTTWRIVWVTAIGCMLVVLMLELAAGALIPFFFGAEYIDAVGVTRLLLASAFFVSVRRVLADCARGLGLPGVSSASEAVSWLTLAPALAVLGPLYQLPGVALAFAVSSGVSLTGLTIAVKRSRGRASQRCLRSASVVMAHADGSGE